MNRNIEFYNELKEIIVNNVLAVSSAEIDNIYDYWELNKDKKETTDFKYRNFTFSDDKIHGNQYKPKTGAILKGIDLPTWFGDYSKKKIMILGIDPLRNQEVFRRESANVNTDVIIGTPYALHECVTRENACAAYWTLIEGLSKENFVYCTDIFKTYYLKTNKIRSYRDEDFIKNANHQYVLTKEINLIKPDVIIVFGSLAHTQLLKEGCPKISQNIFETKKVFENAVVYTVIHLSKGAYNRNMSEFLNANGFTDINPSDRIACANAYLKLLGQHI
jgi:hypothetical protein